MNCPKCGMENALTSDVACWNCGNNLVPGAARPSGSAFECSAWVADAGEVPPYERAKGMAVACWRVRETWCQQAYDFWLGQYAATGEPEAQAIVNRMRDLWNTVRARREALEGARAVGGSWLAEATIEQRKAKSATAKLIDDAT